MSGHIVRVVTPSTHNAELEIVDDYLVNERDGDAALNIVRAAVQLPEGAKTMVLPSDLSGSSFNNTGVTKGGFLKLASRTAARGSGLQP